MPISVPEGTTKDIDVTASGKSIKSGINVQGTSNTVNATFTSGTLSILNSDDYGYSAIMTEAGGVIGSLNANISGTTITVNGGKAISGALIKSMNKITAMNVDISGNTLTGNGSVTGGLVATESIGQIGSITGNGFKNNTITLTSNADVSGGILSNQGTLNSITNTTFTGNTIQADSGNINGGVFSNTAQMTGNISGVSFVNNKITSKSGSANGAAIYNTGVIGGKIINSTFTDNTVTASNGTGHGGAIYTTTDLIICANAATSKFQNNKVVDSTGTRNEGIYVDSRIAKLTLETLSGGNILIYDDIDGGEGYNLTINGDSAGKVGLYGNITNANFNVTGGNVDFVNSKTTDFNFGQFNSASGAKYSIDLNVGTGKADNFIVGTGSSGLITINSLNVLGTLPDESKQIKILNTDATNSIGISLTQAAIDAFNKTETRNVTWSDEVPANLSFGDLLYNHERNDTVRKTISTVASVYGGLIDSLQYTVTVTEGSTTSSVMGDTLRIMNQANSSGVRSFTANTSRNLYTVTENLGATGTGTFNVVGVYDDAHWNITTKIDANNHTLFKVDKASTLNLSDVLITNAKDVPGAILNITNPNAVVNLSNVTIDNTNGTNAIINNGTINTDKYVDLYSGITGNGTLNINFRLGLYGDNSNIEQSSINILNGELAVYTTAAKLNADINVSKGAVLNVYSSNIGGNIVNNGVFKAYSGDLDYTVSGTGRTDIYGNVNANKLLGNAVSMSEKSVLNIAPDNVGGTITQYGTNTTDRSTVNLLGDGTLNNVITGQFGRLNINGDVVSNVQINCQKYISSGATLTIAANKYTGSGWGYLADQNNGTIIFTGGRLTTPWGIQGSGTIRIRGDVDLHTDTSSQADHNFTNNIIIEETGTLTSVGSYFVDRTITNNGIFNLAAGTLSRPVTGTGTTNITGPVTMNANLASANIDVKNGATLNINANNIGGTLNNDGSLMVTGGTVAREIHGAGTTRFTGSTTINALIDQTMYSNASITITVNKADYIGANINGSDNTMYLGSGTLNHTINNFRLYTTDKANIVFGDNAQLYGYFYVDGGSLTAKANQLGHTLGIVSGNVYLTGGSFNTHVVNGGRLNITGNVTKTGGQLFAPTTITDTGTFTATINNVFTGSITNNGIFNMAGTLNRNIAGTGTTRINGTNPVVFTDGAAVAGVFDFNGGTLNTEDKKILDYSIGKVTGTGTWSMNFDATSGKSDTFTLGQTSNAVITPEITLLNVGTTFQNKVFQVFKGKSGPTLNLGTGTKTINLLNRDEDFVTKADVYFNDTYEIRDKTGTGSATLSLATTDNANDSIKMSLNSINWGETVHTRKDLFHDWLNYSAPVKNFNFRAATDVFNAIDGLYDAAITTTVNVNGVVNGATRSKLDFGSKYVGFRIGNGGKLTFSNVEIDRLGTQGADRTWLQINSGGWATFNNIKYNAGWNISYHINNNGGTIDNISGEIFGANGGYCVRNISGGKINNISAIFRNNSRWGNDLRNEGSTSVIGTIDSSVFQDSGCGGVNGNKSDFTVYNQGTINNFINTQFNRNNTSSGTVGTLSGAALTNSGTITNFSGNTFDSNRITTNANILSRGQGAAIYNTGTFTNGILDSTFIGNYIDASGGFGAAIVQAGGAIKVIDNSTFTGNNIKYNPNTGSLSGANGGAIFYVGGSFTDGIKNSTFDGNYIEVKQKYAVTNASWDAAGGAIYNNTNNKLLIDNCTFLNNYVMSEGTNNTANVNSGAVYGLVHIKGGLFDNNYISSRGGSYVYGGAVFLGGASIVEGATFTRNHSSREGGAIATNGNPTIDGMFEGNYAGTSGGAIGTQGSPTIKGTYKGNYAGHIGGAIYNWWDGKIPLITATFEGNHAAYGGAIGYGGDSPARSGYFDKIKDSTFTGNYATQQGGAIYNRSIQIKEILNSTFDGNYVSGGNDVYGGAIFASGYGVTGGIYNSVFRNNYANGKNISRGGAIYTDQSLRIGARDGGETIFSGNYRQINGGEKLYEAIYFNTTASGTALTLQANTSGTITFDDYITGANGFNTVITGDGTGKLKLFNNINNSKITAENIYFDTANNKIFNYNFLSFNTANTVKYKLDLNMADGKADNFTLGYGSTGVMTIDDINFIGTSNQNRTFQVIKNAAGANTELAFSKTKYGSYNVVDNFLESAVPDTVYNDGDYRQQVGIILGTTNTYHDSIQYIANETRYDPLTIIVGKETTNARSLVFRNNNGITLGSDLCNVTAGTLSIVGTAAKNTINANGHRLFNLANETNFTVSNINLTGVDDVITVSNAYTIVNLNNTNITGNIKGNSSFKLNLGGDSNRINGVVSNATTTLNSGTLTFNRNTFSDSGKLVANGGAIDFRNDNVENFVINDLSSNAAARYNLDINLNDFTSDTITIKSSSASGVVTVDDVNYLGNLTLADIGKHPIKVLNTTSNAITLALSDEVKAKSFVLGDIRREEQDTVAMVTNFDTVYYNYYRLGNVVGKLSVSSDSPDSITINAIDEWNSNRVATSVLGDTLELVAKSDLAVRILQANKSTDAYNVGSDVGTVTKGELVISGVNDGVESSTINLANHRGFVLGKDTSLSINSAKIIGSDTPIEITDSSARVELNDAYLSGGIKSNVSYDLSLIGNGTTIVNGALTNAQATLSRGGFKFNKDTFAGANTSLRVDGGSVLMNDGVMDEYVFNNLISNAGASYAIDVDLSQVKGDIINVKSGSGVISINSFTVSGDLIEANQDYNIRILKANGNPVTLAISDVLLSQLKDDFKLGACITTEYETLNPITRWNTIYHKDETTHDILGRFKLNDAKDSIVVTPKTIVALGTQTLVWDDTLKLWNQLESNTAKQFNFDAASNVYNVTANLGSSSAGTLSVNGAGSGSSISTINADGNTLFELPDNTTLNLTKVKITNGRNAAGSILNLTNSNAKANINNVIINSTGGSNGINNAGTLTFTGGTNTINSGVSGTSGVLNINNGAVVNFGANSNITQSAVNVSNGSLTLDITDIIYGNVTVGQSGSATMSGSAITQALSNAGKLNLLSGTLAFAINGGGSTTVSGEVTSRGAINQAVTVASGGSLSISASNIGGNVSNANNLILTGGQLAKQVSGAGKTTIRGNVTANSTISQAIDISSEGALTTNASNIGGAVTNARELNLTAGTLNKNVSGAGRTNIGGDVTVNSAITGNSIHLNSGVLTLTKNSDISGASQLNIHDGAINLQDNSVNTTNLGNVLLNSDLDISIDAALGTKTADMITATSLSNADNHSIIIKSIKVVSDTGESLPIEVLVADNILRGVIKLSSEVISVQGANTQNNYLVTYAKENGKLTFAYGSLSTAITLTTSDRQYNLAADETSSLGVENGSGSTLTVNGNNHKITVSSGGQWTIGSDRTVNLNDVTIQNADTTAVRNSGNLNLKNVTFKNNSKDIDNNGGTLTLTGTNILDNLSGGTITVSSGQTTVNTNLAPTTLAVNSSATLKNKGITQGSVTNAGMIENTGSLTLTGGTNTGTINGAGTTTVDGNFTNSNNMQQSVVVNSGKTLTNSGTVTGTVTNKGTISNTNALVVKGGSNTGTISGEGTTTIDGDFTNSSTLTQTLVVNSGKTLTNNGTVTGTLTNRGTISNTNALVAKGGLNIGTINNNSTFTAENFTNNSGAVIANANILNLNGGSNSGTISGIGNTTITGDYTNNSIITQGTVAVDGGKTLTNKGTITAELNNTGSIANTGTLALKGGTNSGTISGTGNTSVDENLTNSGEITQNNLTISVEKKLTNTQDGTISVNSRLTNNGEIANAGTLTLKGTNNTGKITGSGTMNVQGEITVNKAITQGNINISIDKKLTNSAGITSNITNDGTFDNNELLTGNLTNKGSAFSSASNLAGNVNNTGSLRLEGGTYGNYSITGTGSTIIYDNFTNNGSITQNDITLNSGKTLTNNAEKTITANNNFTNLGTIYNNGTLSGTNFANNAGASISNAGTLNFNGGTNSGSITGAGNTNFSGNVTNNSTITQTNITNSGTLTNNSAITGNITNTGSLTSVADNLVGDVTNSGTLNLNGGRTQGNISGNGGNINVNGDLVVADDISGNTLALNSDSTTTLSGGSLNLEGLSANGGSLNAQNNSLDSINLGNVVLNSDLNLAIDADLASKTSDTISGSTLTTNGHNIIINSINVLTDATDDMAFEINVADEILRSCVKLSGDSIAVAGVKENINYLVSYSTSTGNLTFTYGDLDSALHLTASQRNYTLGSDENITRDLGAMEDGQDVLTINGNNHNIIGNGHNGIIINDGNTLNINNVAGMKGFVTALDNKADGKLNISNTTFTDNEKDILNAGLLTFGGTNNLNTLEGSGKTTINNGQTTVNQTLSQETVEIKSTGSLVNKGDLDVNHLKNAGSLNNSGTADIENLTNTGTISNSISLNLNGGSNTGRISGVGTTTIDGDFTNSGDLTQTLVVNQTLTNSGTVTGDVTNKGTITNSNSLFVTGGENLGTIDGTGTTTIDGDFTNSNSITQGVVTVNSEKTLTNTGTITAQLQNNGTISNSKTLNITGGSNNGTISGEGFVNVSNNFVNNGDISQTGITNNGNLSNNGAITGLITNNSTGVLTSSASNLIGQVNNSGVLNLTGGQTQADISGTSGTVNVVGNLDVSHNISGNNLGLNSGAVNLAGGTLNLDGTTANGGTLNAQNNKADTMNLGNVILNENLSISIDTDLSEKWADKFTGTGVSSTDDYNIVISNINILAGSSDKMPVSLTVTDNNLKNNVKLDSALKVNKDESIQDSYFISYGKDNGQLKFEYSTLPVAVHSGTEQKVYVMSKNEVITTGDFGKIGGKTLSINGSGNTISGSAGVEGLIVEKDQELSFNELTYSGFDTGVTNDAGTVNITDTRFENNTTDIENNSVLNFYGEDFINNVVGIGTTNVSSYKTSDGKVVNAVVTLNEGGTFAQSALNIDSDNKFVNNGTVNVENITNKGILTNNTKLSLTSGSNSGSIVGKGDMDVSGKFTSTGVIDQNTLKVSENAEFTVALDKVNTTGKNITNEGTLFAANGTNSLKIEGSGKTEIVGKVVNTGTIQQKSITVAKDGKLTTSLDNLLTDEIINSGSLHISDGKIDKNISGTETGLVNIDHSMFVNSTVSGTGVALNDGVVRFGSNANLAHSSNFVVNGGTINLVDNRAIDSINLGQKITMNKDLDVLVDVDLAGASMDKISADSLEGDGFINIKYMNVLSDAKENKTRIEFANEALKNNVKSEVKTLSFSPIWMYGVDYDKATGEFLFTKGGSGAGGGYKAFNPAVLSSPVATQISGHLTMTQTISEAFEHSDWYFRLPKNDRFARMHDNQYAISTDYNGNLGKLSTNYANEGIWSRPYANFESVNLSGGPKVNVMSYGTIVGGDSDFRKLSNGWAYVSSAYVGYNGSQFNYDGVSTTSNGGMLGMTATFYKGNFYTALTATAGAGFSETHNMYGKEDITMFMGGIASKSGYNIELNDGKFIIQPNLLMSYSFVGTFNYTNSGGVKIDNDPMHTIQVAPNLRFIGNTKHGWQPYATVGMVWNIMNDTHSTANGYRLPEMSTRPYIEYGIGLQKLWNDNFSAYGQAVMRNGGRTGVALTAGFKWNIGKDTKPTDTVKAPVPSVQRENLVETTHPERKIIKQLSAADCAKMGIKPAASRVSTTSRTGFIKEL